jgi:hypothetical protein
MTDDFLIFGSDGIFDCTSVEEMTDLIWHTAYELQTNSLSLISNSEKEKFPNILSPNKAKPLDCLTGNTR